MGLIQKKFEKINERTKKRTVRKKDYFPNFSLEISQNLKTLTLIIFILVALLIFAYFILYFSHFLSLCINWNNRIQV